MFHVILGVKRFVLPLLSVCFNALYQVGADREKVYTHREWRERERWEEERERQNIKRGREGEREHQEEESADNAFLDYYAPSY